MENETKKQERPCLVRRGYFPKELPPPFQTTSLADSLDKVRNRWKEIRDDHLTRRPEENKAAFKERKQKFIDNYSSSSCANFSISKGKISRRVLKMPNPLHFIELAELIEDNWKQIYKLFHKSLYSKSFPVLTTNSNQRSVHTYSKDVQDFRNYVLLSSADKMVQVRVDISKFYPSVYTHSITWATLGKSIAKNYFSMSKPEFQKMYDSGDEKALLYKLANDIDIAVRSCQDRQSIGIPIGPDTSHVISEIIATRIDSILQSEYSNFNLSACRYYDDYYLFVNTLDEADQVLKGLQRALNEFELEVNESKIEIRKFPFGFEESWVAELFQFQFKGIRPTKYIFHRKKSPCSFTIKSYG